jgi:hypothetical protein
MKNTHEKLFSNLIDKTISSNDHNSTSDLLIPLRQQSIQSINKISKHYKEFQYALYTLKIAAEDLWRLELEQLHNRKPISSNLSSTTFDLQVPSIYTCRTILPVASETLYSKNKISSSVNSPVILQPSPTTSNHKTILSKMGIKNKMDQSNIQSVPHKQKSKRTFVSRSKTQKQYESGDNSTKFWTKTALLHLKFLCSKHTHMEKALHISPSIYEK